MAESNNFTRATELYISRMGKLLHANKLVVQTATELSDTFGIHLVQLVGSFAGKWLSDACRTDVCPARAASLSNPSPSEHVPRGPSRHTHHSDVSACEVYGARVCLYNLGGYGYYI